MYYKIKKMISFSFIIFFFTSFTITIPQTKKGGICFRTDDNQPIERYLQYGNLFTKYNQKFTLAINYARSEITPSYISGLLTLQNNGHEIMDHTPMHRTNTFEALFPNEYTNHPGVQNINGTKVSLKFKSVDYVNASHSGYLDIIGNKLISSSGEFASFKKKECYFYFPDLDKLVFVHESTGWLDNNTVQILDVWWDPIDLGAHNNVKYYNFDYDNVHLTKDGIKALVKESIRRAEYYGLQRPYSWVQPGGYHPQLERNELKLAISGELGFKSAGVFPNPGLKVFNEYNPENDKQFGMNFGDFRDDIWSTQQCKTLIADRIAKHHVVIGESHFTWGYEGLLGDWSGFLQRTEELIQWCIANDIPIKTYSEWSDILYRQTPNPNENIFPLLNVDLDQNNIPDGYNTLAGTLDKNDGALQTSNYSVSKNQQGEICKIVELGGIEKGLNDFEIWTKGFSGDFIEVIFKVGSSNLVYKFPAESSSWTKYNIAQSVNGNTQLNIPISTSLIDVTINCSNYTSGNVKVSGMKLAKSLGSEEFLNVSTNNINVNSLSVIETINITSNISWTVSENLNWLSVTPLSGNNNQTINIQIEENNSSIKRIGEIIVSGNGISETIHIEQNPAPAFELQSELFLEGAYTYNSMNSTLSSNPNFPTNQPYNIAPWNYNGTESVTSTPYEIVDWILVSLRKEMDKDSEVARHAALLKSDGSIVGLNGIDPQVINVNAGNYYLVVEHRNHLPIMSKEKIEFLNTIVLDCDPPTNDLFIPGRGCFEETTGSWVAFNNNSIQQSNDYHELGAYSLKITANTAGSGAYLFFNSDYDLTTNLIINHSYKLRFTAFSTTPNTTAKAQLKGDSGIFITQPLTNSPTTYELNFTADNTHWDYF
ncbi:MAG: hypothetical protein KDC90_13555, partial [Ignavibacteriae bacterium]|nr:hypothetical protein [Ignavibacteriota bacterium]